MVGMIRQTVSDPFIPGQEGLSYDSGGFCCLGAYSIPPSDCIHADQFHNVASCTDLFLLLQGLASILYRSSLSSFGSLRSNTILAATLTAAECQPKIGQPIKTLEI